MFGEKGCRSAGIGCLDLPDPLKNPELECPLPVRHGDLCRRAHPHQVAFDAKHLDLAGAVGQLKTVPGMNLPAAGRIAPLGPTQGLAAAGEAAVTGLVEAQAAEIERMVDQQRSFHFNFSIPQKNEVGAE